MQEAERKGGPEAGRGDEVQPLLPLPPLAVSGQVVSQADLVAALRAYVPQLVDIVSLDGQRFLLLLPPAAAEGGKGPQG